MTVDEVNGIDRVEELLAAEEDERHAARALYGHRSGSVTRVNTFNNDDAPAVASSRGA